MSAKINYDFYEGEDIYNDGDIEQELIDLYKNDINYNPKEYKDLAYFYLLTPIRQNILNWYPFDKNSNVLEIGAGAGTITGMLCDKVKNVTVVEASKRRAELIYNRHKNKDNLEILVGNFNTVNFKQKFDYIVMIGVLEYSKIFSSGDNPYKCFLKTIVAHLTDKGKLLVAIENKNGLKYWCGANEDHLSKPYVGIENYNNADIKTFGKVELKNLLEESGFLYQRFYYPFPDYKIPFLVYTDEYLPDEITLKESFVFNHDDYGYNVNPINTLNNIINNNMVGDMANSFLVEASVSFPIEKKVDFAKLNKSRNKKYATITKIMEDNIIVKESVYEEGKNHLNVLEDTHKKLLDLGISCSKIQNKVNHLEIEFINGVILTNVINDYYYNNDKDRILLLIDDVFKYIEERLVNSISIDMIKNDIFNFNQFYNKKIDVLKIGLIDLNFSNIMIKDNKYIFIDQEWVTDEMLPFDYIKYFSIKLLYDQINGLNTLIPSNELYEKYNISIDMQNAFNKASENYFFEVNDVFDYKTYTILLERKNINLREGDDLKLENSLKLLEEKDKIILNQQKLIESKNEELTKIINSKTWTLANKIRKIIKK